MAREMCIRLIGACDAGLATLIVGVYHLLRAPLAFAAMLFVQSQRAEPVTLNLSRQSAEPERSIFVN